MESDTITLLKSAAIKYDSESVFLIIFSYHTEHRDNNPENPTDKSKSFYRCDACLKKISEWYELADKILKDNPAEISTLKDLGIDLNYKVYYGDHYLTHSNLSRWLRLKVGKSVKLEKWLSTKPFESKEPYLKTLENSNGDKCDISIKNSELPANIWYGAVKQKQPRKKPKIIF